MALWIIGGILLLLILEKYAYITVGQLVTAHNHFFSNDLIDKIKEERVICHSRDQSYEFLCRKVAG